jgi:uncharacterized protein
MPDGALSVRSLSWKDTTLINICDADLIGKTLNEGRLKMHISRDYFGGQIVDGAQALRLMKESSIINLAGQTAVGIALSNKLGAEKAVRMIEGVPFLMIYKFSY